MGESARTSTSSGCFIVPVQSSSSIEQLIHMPAWRLGAGDLHDVMLISASRSSRLAFAAVITRAASVVGAGNDAAAKCFGDTRAARWRMWTGTCNDLAALLEDWVA